jgi:hypothetical protein
MEEKPDPLNPPSEQKLFEKLSMGQEEYEAIEFIRRHMQIIVKQEKERVGKQ